MKKNDYLLREWENLLDVYSHICRGLEKIKRGEDFEPEMRILINHYGELLLDSQLLEEELEKALITKKIDNLIDDLSSKDIIDKEPIQEYISKSSSTRKGQLQKLQVTLNLTFFDYYLNRIRDGYISFESKARKIVKEHQELEEDLLDALRVGYANAFTRYLHYLSEAGTQMRRKLFYSMCQDVIERAKNIAPEEEIAYLEERLQEVAKEIGFPEGDV
jgi:hypothetical protein